MRSRACLSIVARHLARSRRTPASFPAHSYYHSHVKYSSRSVATRGHRSSHRCISSHTSSQVLPHVSHALNGLLAGAGVKGHVDVFANGRYRFYAGDGDFALDPTLASAEKLAGTNTSNPGLLLHIKAAAQGLPQIATQSELSLLLDEVCSLGRDIPELAYGGVVGRELIGLVLSSGSRKQQATVSRLLLGQWLTLSTSRSGSLVLETLMEYWEKEGDIMDSRFLVREQTNSRISSSVP